MRYVAHSVRSAEEVKQLPAWHGIHLEVRDRGTRLIVQPEPFENGQDLEQVLAEYRHHRLFVQLQSEGIAPSVLALLRLFCIDNFTLLGCSPATCAMLREQEEKSYALRVSDHEPAEWALSHAGQVEWIWIEGAHRLILSRDVHAELRRRFKLCLASPETYTGNDDAIADFARHWRLLPVDAVCTRRPDLWQTALSQLAAEDAANDLADQESLLSLLRQAA